MRGFRCWTVDTTVAFFFYVSNHEVSFNIAVQFADLPFLTAVVDQYIEFDQQHSGHKYNAATRCKISGPLLESAYEDTTRRDAGDRLVTATLPFRSDDAAYEHLPLLRGSKQHLPQEADARFYGPQ
jgi:hypothetical protein